MRLTALLVLTALLFACTHQVAREKVGVREYRVEWEALKAPLLRWEGLEAQGVVLTPAQWPLETSLKRLMEFDLEGFIAGLDFSFHSSRIPTGVLEELFEEGYLPAYVRVENPGEEPRRFDPLQLAVNVDERVFMTPIYPEDLPATFKRIDWIRTGTAAIAMALVVVLLVAAAKEGRSSHVPDIGRLDTGIFISSDRHPTPAAGDGARAMSSTPEPGLLSHTVIAPRQVREGILLFRLEGPVRDWTTARLVLNR